MATELDDFREASAKLQAGIEKTKCGYCKMIAGDAKEVIDRYLKIVSDLQEIDVRAQGEKDFLGETQKKVNEVLRPQETEQMVSTEKRRELPKPTLNPLAPLRDMRRTMSPFGGNGILSGILNGGPLRQRMKRQ